MRMKIWASCGRVDDGGLARLTGKRRHALGVGLGQVFDRRAFVAGGFLVGDAELVAGKARPRRGRRDQHVALQLQAGCRRAIEEAAFDLKFYRNFSFDLLVLGR